MKLDELRDKARLTDEQITSAYFGFKTLTKIERFISDAATDKTIVMMMEEFKAVVDTAQSAVNSCACVKDDQLSERREVLAAYAALQEGISNG